MSNWIKKGIIFDKEWAQLPVVDVYHDYYKIYYSTRDEQGRSIPKCIFSGKKFIYKSAAYNIDIPLGKPGSFDSHGIMPSDIITLEDGTKYMYYVGWSKRIDVPYWNSTGLAISKDNGNTWKKYSEGPVLSSNINESGFIGTVSCSKNKWLGTYDLFYSSCNWEIINGKHEPVYGIRQGSFIFPNDINHIVDFIDLKDNEGGIASFREVGNKYFYSKRNKLDYRINIKNSYKIYSVDMDTEKEKLELEPEGDELMTAYPFIIEEKDKYIMFYNSDFGSKGISYAELKK